MFDALFDHCLPTEYLAMTNPQVYDQVLGHLQDWLATYRPGDTDGRARLVAERDRSPSGSPEGKLADVDS